MRSILLLLLLALTPSYLAAQQQPPVLSHAPQAQFSFDTDREPVISLKGKWRFQPGDNPAYASPTFDDSQWQLIDSDRMWPAQLYHNKSGLAWYRFRVILPPGSEPIALYLPPIRNCYQVFADGALLVSIGRMPPNAAPYDTNPMLIPLSAVSRPEQVTITVALRVWHNPRWAGNGGGPTRESQLGTMDRIEHVAREHAAAQAWSMTAALNLALIELIAAIVALAMYSLRRSEREYFWFTVVSLCEAFVYILNFYGATHPVRIYVAWSSYAVDFALRGVAGLFFYRTLLRGRTDLLFRISIFAIAPLSAEYWLLLSNSIPPGWWFCTSIVLELPGFIWISLLLLKGLRQRLPDARLLIIPLLMYAVVYLLELTDSFLKQLDRPGLPFSIYLLETPIRISYDDLSELLFLLAMLAILIARFARTSRNQDRISSEFEAARTLQHVLIPEDIPRIPNLTIATAYHPAMEVGGDFFQILPLPTGDTLIILGDVAGKGLPAAMTVSLLVGALRTLAEQTHSPAEILAGLNRRLLGRGSGFTTCLILRISPNGLLTLASAGHLPPYLNGHELPTEASLPLGLSPDTTFIEQTRTLSPKDHLTLLTDGVPEAQCRHELFGFPRTEALSLEPAATIAQVARAFGQTDDITVLSVIFAIA